MSQSTLSIKELELEVNKLHERLDSIDSKYDTFFDKLASKFRAFQEKYSIANTLNFDERILEIESFIEDYKTEKEIDFIKEINEETEENNFQFYFISFLCYSSSYFVVILVSFSITLLFFSFHYKLISHSLNFKPQNTQTNLQ